MDSPSGGPRLESAPLQAQHLSLWSTFARQPDGTARMTGNSPPSICHPLTYGENDKEESGEYALFSGGTHLFC